MADHPNELSRGTPVGGYKIRQRIGAGATGTVYAALDPRSGRKVAVKVLHPHLQVEGDEGLERLREQCAALSALRHPGVIVTQEVGRLEGGPCYLISEFALGQPLTDLLQVSGPLAPDEARPLLEALALILATTHGHDFVHGGLTPDNIWVTPREGGAWPPMLRVMDFGMAELRGRRAGDAGPAGSDEVPYYLSPEQCRGEAAGAASDIYALGVIAYQMLTGRVPFSSDRPGEVVKLHLEEAVRPPSDLAPLAPAVDQFVLRALAKEPKDRFETMLQFRQALPALDEAWPRAETASEDAGYESYDLEDPRSGGAAGEIAGRSGPDPAAGPAPIEMDAVIVEHGAREEAPQARAEERADERRPRERSDERSRARARGLLDSVVVSTAVLPAPERPRARVSPLGAAFLGLGLALLLGLGAYRVLAGSWPWMPADRPAAADGQVQVLSVPPGARVTLNEIEQPGRTPLTLTLRQGRPYLVGLRLEGHPPWQQTVALALGEEERQLRVVLSEGPPRFGTLKLHANVAADFFLDGRKVGTQTRHLTLAEVRADAEHELRVVAPGHQPLLERVRVGVGGTRVLELQLQPIPLKAQP